MVSEKYKRFLELESQKNPLKIEGSLETERLKVSWENSDGKPVETKPSDIIDSIYLGQDMRETVVVDRRVAAMLQDRLKGLEEENMRVRRRIKIMKVAIGALLFAVALIALLLLKTIFPQNIVIGG